MAKSRLVALVDLSVDLSMNQRADGISYPVVAEYMEASKRGDAFPPVTIFDDGDTLWLADGFHRVKAAEELRHEKIRATVQPGKRRDAILYACGANAEHGARRTNRDKRRAVETLLREFPRWSDRRVGEAARVDNAFVGRVRRELLTVNSSPVDPVLAEVEQRMLRDRSLITAEPAAVVSSLSEEYELTEGDVEMVQSVLRDASRESRNGRTFYRPVLSADDEPTESRPKKNELYPAYAKFRTIVSRVATLRDDLEQEYGYSIPNILSGNDWDQAGTQEALNVATETRKILDEWISELRKHVKEVSKTTTKR